MGLSRVHSRWTPHPLRHLRARYPHPHPGPCPGPRRLRMGQVRMVALVICKARWSCGGAWRWEGQNRLTGTDGTAEQTHHTDNPSLPCTSPLSRALMVVGRCRRPHCPQARLARSGTPASLVPALSDWHLHKRAKIPQRSNACSIDILMNMPDSQCIGGGLPLPGGREQPQCPLSIRSRWPT